MSAVVFDSEISVLPNSTLGHIAGEGVGIVTFDNVPGVAVIDLLRRSDNAWLRRTISAPDGTYSFTGLTFGEEYDVIGHDITDTWDDVIVGRVVPFLPLSLAGNAPGCVVGVPYLYVYAVSGGELPYAFTLTGDLPDGLTLVATTSTVQISGTATALAANETFEIEVEDARGATAAIVDEIEVIAVHQYWRVNISASNTHPAICELEMASVASGSNMCVGGLPISGGDYPPSGHEKENAFDGSLAEPPWAGASAPAGWLGYAFPVPVAIAEVRICARWTYGQSPRDFTIESSDDGIAWTVEATVAGVTSWPSAAFLAFAV